MKKISFKIFIILLIPLSLSAQVWDISDVQRIAVENNLSVHSASQRHLASKWGVVNAVSSFLPRLDFRTTLTRLDPYTLEQANIPAQFFPGFILTPKDAYESSLSLTIPIFNGGLLYSNFKAASARKGIEGSGYRKAKLEIKYAAVSGYLNYLRAREFLEVQRQSLESSEKNLDKTRSQFELGQRSRTDLLRWEVDVADKQLQLLDAENSVQIAKLELCRVLGIPQEKLPELRPVDDSKFQRDYSQFGNIGTEQLEELIESWFTLALENHPDFEMLKAREELASSDIWRARAQMLPKVNFAYNYSWQKDYDLFLDERTFWSAMLIVDLPLFTGLGNYADLRRAKAMRRAEFYSVEDARKTLRLQLTSTVLNMRTALLKVVSADLARSQAKKNLDITKQKYELGLFSIVELLDAETAYFGSYAGYIDALYTYYILSSRVESLVGREDLTSEFTYEQ